MPARNIWIVVALALLCSGARAQWLNHPTPGTPRTKDGNADLSAPAPRAADGKPDLSGIWQPDPSPIAELKRFLPGGVNALGESTPNKYFINILADFEPGQEPLLPALKGKAYTMLAVRRDDPRITCLPIGMPIAETIIFPVKVVQTPGLIIMLVESETTFRQIFTDGRKFPDDSQPSWMGYSVGKWEGDVLRVDTIGFNDRGWLDTMGHTHSEALHITERFHRLNFGRMEVQMTLDDPKIFTQPVTIKLSEHLLPDTDLIESYCSENEKDLAHTDLK